MTPHFTPRQREVAELLAAGYSHRETAQELGISQHTVRQHARTIHYRLPGSGSLRVRIVAWLRTLDTAGALRG